MFRALFAHPQEAHTNGTWYIACVSLQSWHRQLTHARTIPSAVCIVPTEDEQVMIETCRVP
jgi:hypothetical protein